MKSITQYRKATVSAAEKIMKGEGMTLVSKMDELLSSKFPASQQEIQNDSVIVYQQIMMDAVAQVQVLERYIGLHVPQMEDGNNFGVTVQMTICKFLKDTREEWMKHLEKIPTFYSAKADAMDKCDTEKSSAAETKTQTESNIVGGKDGDEIKTITVSVKENKTTCDDADKAMRKDHLQAINIQCFISVKTALTDSMTSYLSILDNMEKNISKLTSPKGSGTSMGMY
uniref:Proteasome activator PA28 C-terminal domain-containing protein n=1 Tax=Eucampia antarctica TaxID=49252 RepID=A0A6U0T7X5_9STRA|mmetsp:Transcript_4243/g.4027  ORF Transcript_4243/g.4027 Transcript_4243/m.4027 type:complete len:227 (+) Transcript_4243:126-806(+)|eukprot:CAMPEP_0197835210 /NCGR_PEP_ID=MMETSP1437-20131217/25115_1 /TAXON_ID=49252 ORGANISM="Eucampia antarctica, Strain CCMP1452" /NCGR_SAMPLE_ID=MMETSP1437 /ASSEMBLY_ACC=CAM_ASM_001096 /LENGTH=226 /DNA_ID=CAMNT_0043440461 /DNA_START=147 /DNA_END=827 /DNA_ORIENTATION=+